MNTTKQPQLKLENVSKRFLINSTPVEAVKNVTISIYPGQLITIVGPSGSGKTTLSQIIGGLMQPTEGRVYFDNQPINVKNDRQLSHYRNQTVGFIFQNYHLIPHYTALENVMVPLFVSTTSISARKSLAKQQLQLVGLSNQLHQRADQLSGGQKQRVAIARALVMQPQLIIADEPTGNLDSQQGEAIMKTLEDLAHKQHITVIMVTHNDAMAARADRIITMKDGVTTEVHHANA
jgi:ABC-type lipoprotein export system ATPase subunit